MNVFILDKNMERSAQMLDDLHLRAQINEATQILMANYNREYFPDAKIGHVNHPVTKFYEYGSDQFGELFEYLSKLLVEYNIRFNKYHQNDFWFAGFCMLLCLKRGMTMNSNTPKPTWTNREKPDWWEVK